MSSLKQPVVNVAVGIIFHPCGDILISQRPSDKSYSGYWEFPGGKIEKDESIFEALQRELLEEVGIQVVKAEAWLELDYSHTDRNVFLHIWRVTQFSGEPTGLESQLVHWVPLHQLNQFLFLPGNASILEQLQLHHEF